MQSIIHSGIVVYVEDLSLPWPSTGNMLKEQYHAISMAAPQWHCWCPHAIRKNNCSFHSSFMHCQRHVAKNALKVTAKTYDGKLFLCRNFMAVGFGLYSIKKEYVFSHNYTLLHFFIHINRKLASWKLTYHPMSNNVQLNVFFLPNSSCTFYLYITFMPFLTHDM
jgi:hypothetical protein